MDDPLRETSTRELLLEATSRRLWEIDESELRILDICKETNLSTSVIYAHFGSRQGLVDASLLRVFAAITKQHVELLSRVVEGSHPSGSYLDTLNQLLTDSDHEATFAAHRQMFFRISSTALSRPSLRSGFLKLYGDFMARTDDLYDTLVRRELLSSQLTGHQWAVFFESQMLSRAIHDLSPQWDGPEDWNRTARRLLTAMMSEQVPAPD
ncbi:MAG: TetR/AcrR family transcriptional regulator [Acidimicrobiales bacterium]